MVCASQWSLVIPIILFLAAVSLAFPSFPPTLPCCASLPLTLLSCFKSTSFPLSLILPLPPFYCSPPLPPLCYFLLVFARVSDRCLLQMPSCCCEAVVAITWQTACICTCVLLFFSTCVLLYTLCLVWKDGKKKEGGDLLNESRLCLMKLSTICNQGS